MRTTLDLESDVLAAAKEIARLENTAVGKVVSRLVRQALAGDGQAISTTQRPSTVTGFEPFPARGVIVTDELIDRLRDTEGV